MKQKNIFTHKFLPILGLIFFILFILLINNSFASNGDLSFRFNNTNYILPNFPFFNKPFFVYCTGGYLQIRVYEGEIVEGREYVPFIYFTGSRWESKFCSYEKDSNGNIINIINNLTFSNYYYDGSQYVKNFTGTWCSFEFNGQGDMFNYMYYATPFCFIGESNGVATEENIKNNVLVFNNNMFYLSNTEPTFSYPQILSKEFDIEKIDYYDVRVSLDDKNWEIFNIEYVALDDSTFIFYYNVFENGNYHIRLYDSSTGQYIYDDYIEVTNLAYSITIEPNEDTEKPIIAKTNNFSRDMYIKYVIEYSTDRKNWNTMNSSTLYYDEENSTTASSTDFFDWIRIYKNGTYYFRFCNTDEIDVYYYVTIEVTNIKRDEYLSDDYIFNPIISLDFNEENQSFIIRSQSILLDKALNLKCFYTNNSENTNIINWNEMEIDFEYNSFTGMDEAYFYFEIPIISASDTDYRIAFYNYFSNKSSEIIVYEFRYDKAIDYVENELKINLSFSIRFNGLLTYFKDRFGFLTYPIEFIFNLLTKILNIEYSEPIINIPEFNIPGTNTKIFNGYSYNFNTLLENQAILNIYNIYLVAVDFIIIISFIVLAYKIIMEVFNK